MGGTSRLPTLKALGETKRKKIRKNEEKKTHSKPVH
jgi:hypothetical protein